VKREISTRYVLEKYCNPEINWSMIYWKHDPVKIQRELLAQPRKNQSGWPAYLNVLLSRER
jgi:hypothetical protein